MSNLKIKEQITFLRKQKCITQEELANALGVTNQAVSKWESGQCCPDIQLLPELAEFFGVSVDALLGCGKADQSRDESNQTFEEMLLWMRNKIESLPNPEDYQFVLKLAYALHAIIWSKEMQKPGMCNHGWDTDSAIEHASVGEWGLSSITMPEITAYMRRESVFFSANSSLFMDNTSMRYICGVLKDFADIKNFKVLTALYNLTICREDAYVSKEEIVRESGLSESAVTNCLEDGLVNYITEKADGGEVLYRVMGMHERLMPLLAMLSITA